MFLAVAQIAAASMSSEEPRGAQAQRTTSIVFGLRDDTAERFTTTAGASAGALRAAGGGVRENYDALRADAKSAVLLHGGTARYP